MLLLTGKARNHVARKHDHCRAGERLHRNQRLAQLFHKRIPLRRISHPVLQAGSRVKPYPKLLPRRIGAIELRRRPLGVLAHQLDVGVARLDHLGQAFFERKIV